MQRHATRPDSKVRQIQQRVPADVVERLRGTHVTFEFPAMRTEPAIQITLKLGDKIKGSLRTQDIAVATWRRLRALDHLEGIYDQARTRNTTHSQKKIMELAGEVYHMLKAAHGDNPGTEAEWESFKALTRAAVEGRIPNAPAITELGRSDDAVMRELLFGVADGDALTAAIDALPRSEATLALDQRVGRLAHWALSRHGMVVAPANHLDLLRQIAWAALDAGWQLKRMAGGNYAPDPKAARFPPFETKSAKISLTDLFERWRAEAKPAGSTVTTWRGIVADFTRHLGHDDAARVTDADVVSWKDHRIKTPSRTGKPRSLRTIARSDLACVRRLYAFAVGNKLLSSNPADGIKVAVKRQAGEKRLPYTDNEIARLLRHAEGEAQPYRRWLPVLLATTGARVGELAQLTSERVCIEDGVPVIRIEPAADGGSLKNEGSERTVPMHPVLTSSGFLDYARSKDGPLFYGKRPRRRKDGKDGEGRHASKGTCNHFGAWVRTLPGFDNPRKAPAHSFRHWWKSAAIRAGVLDSVADHLQGHAAPSVAGGYRHHDDLATLAAQVKRIAIPQEITADAVALPSDEGVLLTDHN